MKTLLAAGLIALVAAIADASYVLGYNHGYEQGWHVVANRARTVTHTKRDWQAITQTHHAK